MINADALGARTKPASKCIPPRLSTAPHHASALIIGTYNAVQILAIQVRRVAFGIPPSPEVIVRALPIFMNVVIYVFSRK